jgi:ketosteroid isomerase-like protein
MRRHLAITLLAVATAAQLGCAPTDQQTSGSESAMTSQAGTAADSAALEKGIADFDVAMNSGNVDAVVALFTADAVSSPPDAPAATGTDAIRQLWTDFLAQGQVTVHNVGKQTWISGDLAAGWGTYTSDIQPAEGSPLHETGEFAAIWQKQADGSWKCVMNIWNRDAPAPSM